MTFFLRSTLLTVAIATLSASRPAVADNQYSITVERGPNAGTYHSKSGQVQCFHSRSQEMLAATFSNLDPSTNNTGVTSGIRVYKPDAAGAKTGEVSAKFGTFTKHTAEYLITKIPLTVTMKGKGADIAGAGKTNDGVLIRVTASCADVVQM